MSMWTKKYWIDASERVVATAAAVLVGALAGVPFASEQFWKVVGATVGVTVLKVLAASQFGSSNTAAMLPAGPDTDRGVIAPAVAIVVVGTVLLLVGLLLGPFYVAVAGATMLLVGLLLLL